MFKFTEDHWELIFTTTTVKTIVPENHPSNLWNEKEWGNVKSICMKAIAKLQTIRLTLLETSNSW